MNKLSRFNVSLWNIFFILGKLVSITCSAVVAGMGGVLVYSWIFNQPNIRQNMHISVNNIGLNINSLWSVYILLIMSISFILLSKVFDSAHKISGNILHMRIFVLVNLEYLKRIVKYVTMFSVVMILGISPMVIIGNLNFFGSANNIGNFVFDTLAFNSFIYLIYTVFKYGMELKNDSELLI